MNDALLQFTEIIDEEITAYEALSELYKIKQSILVQGKSDELWDIDAQIIDRAEQIKVLNSKRKESARYLGDENITLSEVIDKAKAVNDELAQTIQTQRTKLTVLSKSLVLQEKTNLTLIKHGMAMVQKTMDIIVGVVAPHSKQYDKSGKNIPMDKSLISSVEEEA